MFGTRYHKKNSGTGIFFLHFICYYHRDTVEAVADPAIGVGGELPPPPKILHPQAGNFRPEIVNYRRITAITIL